jgi:hypothetical protein
VSGGFARDGFADGFAVDDGIVIPGRACVEVSAVVPVVTIAYPSAAVSVRQGYASANVSAEVLDCP